MILRPFLFPPTACASYLFGCLSHSRLAVVDPHVELVDRYLEEAELAGAPIVAVLETHVQADHVSGLPALVEATGATAYLPRGADVQFGHEALDDGAYDAAEADEQRELPCVRPQTELELAVHAPARFAATIAA